jgi:hypothetical protein
MRKILLFGLLMASVAGAAQAAETVTYSYDALGRLISVSHAGTVNNGQQTSYTYDSADNRTNVTTTGASH